MMAGRSFTRHTNGIGNRIRAEHINELQLALEDDDARIDLKADDGQFVAHTSNTNNPHNVTKAQLGLGNVDNTSDADKPVSTAQQAALDGKADVEDAVPAGGVYGQVLTVTHSGKEWVDPPGIVYPSLLLSPDGSFGKAGAVSPTIQGDVSVVAGQYGQAWKTTGVDGQRVTIAAAGHMLPEQGTVLVRARWDSTAGSSSLNPVVSATMNTELRLYIGRDSNRRIYCRIGASPARSGRVVADGEWIVLALRWVHGTWAMFELGALVYTGTYTGSPWTSGNIDLLGWGSSGNNADAAIETCVIYPDAVPDAEVARISSLPAAWTMQNTAVNMALQSQPPAGSPFLQMYPPNRKIATGGATLRTAPGPSTQAITTLAAGTDVHDTKQTVSVSSVSYSLVVTAFGNAWVPSSTLV